eukprot:scaffold13943_cov18-Tisochrysis_lutea.AAC.1
MGLGSATRRHGSWKQVWASSHFGCCIAQLGTASIYGWTSWASTDLSPTKKAAGHAGLPGSPWTMNRAMDHRTIGQQDNGSQDHKTMDHKSTGPWTTGPQGHRTIGQQDNRPHVNRTMDLRTARPWTTGQQDLGRQGSMTLDHGPWMTGLRTTGHRVTDQAHHGSFSTMHAGWPGVHSFLFSFLSFPSLLHFCLSF